MAKFDRSQFGRGASQQPTPSLVSGSKATSHALIQGRQSGHLKLQGRGLTALPKEVCDIGSVALPEGSAWWETRETLETLNCSQNDISELPDDIAFQLLPKSTRGVVSAGLIMSAITLAGTAGLAFVTVVLLAFLVASLRS